MAEIKTQIPGYCTKVMTVLNSAGFECFIVGGAVRDIVMGKIPSDYDVTTSATPEETIAALDKEGIRYVPTGLKHGTVMAVLDDEKVEITTFRVDGEYSDMRRPDSVTFTRSVDEDVLRRDFTINAMYLDKSGDIIDRTGGLEDIALRRIRAVGDPDKRFDEDALRIMRGLRFAAQTGFTIENHTFDAMVRHAPSLKKISGERIATELNHLVVAPYATEVIRRSVPILREIIPEIAACEGFDQRSVFHDRDVLEHILGVIDSVRIEESGTRDLSLALAALFHDIAKPACFWLDHHGWGHMKGHPEASALVAQRVLTELHYPNSIRDEVVKLVRYHDFFIPEQRYSVHRFMSNCGPVFARRLMILQKADIQAHSSRGKKRSDHLDRVDEIMQELIDEGVVFSVSDLDISGKDLIAMGIPEGPHVGEVMETLFDEYLMEEIQNDRESLLKRAKEIRIK